MGGASWPGVPAGLEPGWYRWEAGGRSTTVVVAPPALRAPERAWGWMLQLYALRSAGSWGIGDLGDLRAFTAWTGREHGARAVLLNPLHAITPVPPVQPSPYTPSSRRFATPLALRIPDLDAYARADAATRAEVDALRPEQVGDRIEHDRVWAAKRAAAMPWMSFAATFPAGTLSGAPKPRALEIIDELEPWQRGVYGGVVGYFDFAGDADLAIAIRTATIVGGLARVQAGAGLVADSDPETEHIESQNKAAAPLRAIAIANAMRRVTN